MKAKGKDAQQKHSDHCGMVFRNDSLREYAAEILERGKGDGSVFCVCEIAQEIANDLSIRGKTLLSKGIIITQRQIFKYRNHPKTAKGANLPLANYDLIEETLKSPVHIYEDTVQNRLVYVCTHPYHERRLIKVVIEPNYKCLGTVINIAKSWGVVQKENMKGGQFRIIK
ncbi:MAG: hypothetical protein IJT04_01880 [Bacteroidales bacterium]|nr:hypothetical protein [Bacteroidales bacterium]